MPRSLSRSSRNRSRKGRSRTVEQEGELSTPEKKTNIHPFPLDFYLSLFLLFRDYFSAGVGDRPD